MLIASVAEGFFFVFVIPTLRREFHPFNQVVGSFRF
jgi:hypothetical protein